ncbi:hypothetical protein EMIHUDRAFT_466248 [Emiliania huxleyi CCMP1516]|uniref:ABC transporter domain-containing protein n=2 Tax=Emiliania huxleyi TaxID=2903 RepID=A0A0D3HZ03_EMIH1|nr:hypothetical protein EMIHUDRAFT_466248 [Emiliania huxleyi CCMP1516]EOD04238.1 hypothetical protein EMIHUDRAFT_466248 [Emiliania huxleyi CCMP1516]|eukprot:XP_005756667.1 hypothetical protein EMIHUDRAFT_466248 [Emiliania huxleyi CCMP1516]
MLCVWQMRWHPRVTAVDIPERPPLSEEELAAVRASIEERERISAAYEAGEAATRAAAAEAEAARAVVATKGAGWKAEAAEAATAALLDELLAAAGGSLLVREEPPPWARADAPHGYLSALLPCGFEPYGVPALPKLIKLLADKDKKVADAATVAAEATIVGQATIEGPFRHLVARLLAMLEGLSTLSVKAVVGALYEGAYPSLTLQPQDRTHTGFGTREGMVQTAAEEALPVLCSCVQNAEVASTLRDFIIDALKKPDKTFECVEEVLMTTFCNPMDGTSLAFMMPIIIRGIKDANYELVKKSTVCASNLCALIKDSSDIAPFVPLLLPLLEKNVEHSSPNIREATQTARERLLEGDLGQSRPISGRSPMNIVTDLEQRSQPTIAAAAASDFVKKYEVMAVTMPAVCTDVTHYDNGGQLGKPCRFVYYPMTFSEFQKLKPEIAAGLPRIDSGPPKSASQPASECSFKYPETDRYILKEVDATVTLGSRAVIVGGNGSGLSTLLVVGTCKSTFLKLLIGDLEPEEGQGEMWKHHALRLSYVAQQSLHHLEDHARFRQGLDAEVAKLKSIALTDDEKAEMEKGSAISAIVGRTTCNKPWYEFQQRGKMKAETQSLPFAEIQLRFPPYVQKLIKNYDQKAQAIESGMAIRPITEAEVLKHLGDFGIDQQLAFGKIRQMSGGQRQRLVICAAFWSKPHVIALDEPTNYLDNDSVAALTKALKDFKGAVVTVSENEAFVNEISNEKWVVEEAAVTLVQLRDAKAR